MNSVCLKKACHAKTFRYHTRRRFESGQPHGIVEDRTACLPGLIFRRAITRVQRAKTFKDGFTTRNLGTIAALSTH